MNQENNKITMGFIGTGNMGSALARAVGRKLEGQQIFLTNRSPEKSRLLAAELGARQADNISVARQTKYIFLGVKPQMMEEMLSEIRPVLTAREEPFVLVTMAAGLTIARIQEMAGGDYPVIRIMPNTPAAIGEGMILYACSKNVSETEKEQFLDACNEAGRFSALSEQLMDAGSAVAGCGPAFAALFLEALADGGLPRALALEYAAQMLAGTARLALETGSHPGALKDAVCSPGGTTIQGVRTLEKAGFRGAVIDAVTASYEKTLSLV